MPVAVFALRARLVAVGLGVASITAAAADAEPAPLAARIDATIEREHAAGRFDGVVLVGRAGAVVFQRAVGLANRATQQPHRVDEPWRLASVSKQVAALLVMQQVERGRLTLQTPLRQLLPDFKSPLAAQITVQQLLQHTSGLPNPDDTLPADAAPGAMPPYYTRRFADAAGPVEAALTYCAGPPAGRPGARFSYNNCDTLVMQAALERLTGHSYAELLDAAVATPLHLTSLRMADATDATPSETPVGYLDAQRVEPAFNLASFGASGALIGSAGDLWRFDQALMSHQLLGIDATRVMWTGDPRLGYVALGAWSFPATLAGCSEPVALVERRGEIGGVQIRNLIAPALGAAVVVLSNTAQTTFGEIWQGKGWMYGLASAAFCASLSAPGLPGPGQNTP
jgi:CubicO group peptidase (beta-lactamase class C family)